MANWHGYAGAEWLENIDQSLSPIGREAADIVGFVWRGIYHLPAKERRASVWDDPHYALVRLSRPSLATWDDTRLTELVVLACQRCIRIEIAPHGFGYLNILFHQRVREGGVGKRHPTRDEIVAGMQRLNTDPKSEARVEVARD